MTMKKPAAPKRVSRPAVKRTRTVAAAIARPDDEQIRARAYELFLQRDGHPGDPLEDWLRAERELLDAAGQ